MTNTITIKDLNTQFNNTIKDLKASKKDVKIKIYTLLDIAIKSVSMYQNTTQCNKLFLMDNILTGNERTYCIAYLKDCGYILSKGVSNTGKPTIKVNIKKDVKPLSLKAFMAFTPTPKTPPKKTEWTLESHLDKLVKNEKAGLNSILSYLIDKYGIDNVKQSLQ